MPGYVQDRWWKDARDDEGRRILDADGKPVRVKTSRFGRGERYKARFIGPNGQEVSQSFPDRQKRRAEEWLVARISELHRGEYIDPRAGQMTFRQYAEEWLKAQTFDESTREATESRLRVHIYPRLGDRPLASILPLHLREFTKALQAAGLASTYQHVIFGNILTILSAAVDDELIRKNPGKADSVRKPRKITSKVVPWPAARVFVVQEGMRKRYTISVDLAAGLGLRQGEIFGLSPDDVNFLRGTVRVRRQVKLVRSRLVFGLPKNDKERDVPLPEEVALRLAHHLALFPAREITLPWESPGGALVAVRLVMSTRERKALNRNYFNTYLWKPALEAAGVEPIRANGIHALRHFYASALLDAGESIKAVSAYLGHSDPGFTLRTYTHLMPTSDQRSRKAIDKIFRREDATSTGPDSAQTAT